MTIKQKKRRRRLVTDCQTQAPNRGPLVCNHYNLVDILSVQMQHKIVRNPFPCIFSGDGIANSLGLPPRLGIFDANPDLITCFTIDQPAGVDDRKGFSTLHQPILHHPLVFVGDLQQDVIQWHHGIRDVATEVRHAGRAAYDNVRLSGHAAASQLGEGCQESGHAFAADLAVVYRQFGHDEFSADGGDDFIDELPVLGH